MSNYFHEARQQANIGQAKADAVHAQRHAESAQEAARKLEKRVDNLTLLCRTMWSFLQERGGLTEADLMARFQEVASAGGGKSASECVKCSRPVGKAQAKCMYCGAEKVVESIFDTL